ncbi:MAG TPA: response regulator [Polyangiaceae bacterium]|jgi:CheY-like chemotaxis protein
MRTVLVVDDSPVVRRALGRRLGEQGFDVRLEESADAARAVDVGGVLCAVIDLEIGDDDGADLAAVLLARRPSLPVAFFTSDAPPARRARALARGPVFDKPDLDAVVAWVARADQPPPTK